jgi:hypothetical protein
MAWDVDRDMVLSPSEHRTGLNTAETDIAING